VPYTASREVRVKNIIFVYYYTLIYDIEIKTKKYTSLGGYWQLVNNGLRRAKKVGEKLRKIYITGLWICALLSFLLIA
jgi:hypothetical protein